MVKSVGTPAMTDLGMLWIVVCAIENTAGTTRKLCGDCTAGRCVWVCQRSSHHQIPLLSPMSADSAQVSWRHGQAMIYMLSALWLHFISTYAFLSGSVHHFNKTLRTLAFLYTWDRAVSYKGLRMS